MVAISKKNKKENQRKNQRKNQKKTQIGGSNHPVRIPHHSVRMPAVRIPDVRIPDVHIPHPEHYHSENVKRVKPQENYSLKPNNSPTPKQSLIKRLPRKIFAGVSAGISTLKNRLKYMGHGVLTPEGYSEKIAAKTERKQAEFENTQGKLNNPYELATQIIGAKDRKKELESEIQATHRPWYKPWKKSGTHNEVNPFLYHEDNDQQIAHKSPKQQLKNTKQEIESLIAKHKRVSNFEKALGKSKETEDINLRQSLKESIEKSNRFIKNGTMSNNINIHKEKFAFKHANICLGSF